MRLALLLFGLLLWTPISHAEEVRRLDGETLEEFAKRNGPAQAALTHKIIETEVWGKQKTVMAFYVVQIKLDNNTPATQVEGYLFVPKSTGTYEKTLIHNFEEEGAKPEIEAVFFANADKDEAKELIVICSWPQRHYDVNGTLYGTFIFDDLRAGTYPTKLSFLESISERVSGDCDCQWRDGRRNTSKYKTAASVKAGLRKLGF